MPRPPKKYATSAANTPPVIEARERFEAAVAALGPLAPIAIHVAICDLSPSTWGANGKPNGDARGLLGMPWPCSPCTMPSSPMAASPAAAALQTSRSRSSARASAAL